jgi:hypothetical protein
VVAASINCVLGVVAKILFYHGASSLEIAQTCLQAQLKDKKQRGKHFYILHGNNGAHFEQVASLSIVKHDHEYA